MRISHDRLIFALSLLDGQENAHRVLADMLEEEGDRGLADWARARKGKRQKRIDFVLALLPHMVSLRLACDFLAESLDLVSGHRWRSPYRDIPRESLSAVLRAVRAVGDWTRGTIAVEDLSAHRSTISQVVPWRYGVQDIDLTMHGLIAAIDYAQTSNAASSSDPVAALHQSRQSRHASRKVAKAAREMVRPVIADMRYVDPRAETPEPPPIEAVDAVAWQLDHTRDVIRELLGGADSDK